eukprot:28736-Chlamydomonas_euryale.AAC.2
MPRAPLTKREKGAPRVSVRVFMYVHNNPKSLSIACRPGQSVWIMKTHFAGFLRVSWDMGPDGTGFDLIRACINVPMQSDGIHRIPGLCSL